MNKRIEYLIHFLGGAIVVAIFSYMIYRQYTPEGRAELKVDAVTYMHTNVGDRVKNR